jgi:23S rRNA pseudouridine955/2504/2580 synthase
MPPDVKAVVTKEIIGPETEGQRLDNFLFRHLKGVPKSRIYRMLREGEVRVSGKRAKPEYKLLDGDIVRIPPVRVAEEAPKPAVGTIDHPLLERVIYRDEAMLVIDKPSGQAVHGGSGVSLGVIEQLRLELPQARFLELAHRLDKETSGVLMLALKRSALVEIHRMLRAGELRKRYLALGCGRWRDPVRHVKLPLQRYLNEDGERRVSVDDEGQQAHTIFRLVHRYEGFSLLEAELKTGRTHQIRVHMAAMGHPIAGDDKYGEAGMNREARKTGLKRMFLHAAKLEMKHPLSGEPMLFEAPLPSALQEFLNHLPLL